MAKDHVLLACVPSWETRLQAQSNEICRKKWQEEHGNRVLIWRSTECKGQEFWISKKQDWSADRSWPLVTERMTWFVKQCTSTCIATTLCGPALNLLSCFKGNFKGYTALLSRLVIQAIQREKQNIGLEMEFHEEGVKQSCSDNGQDNLNPLSGSKRIIDPDITQHCHCPKPSNVLSWGLLGENYIVQKSVGVSIHFTIQRKKEEKQICFKRYW